MINVEEYLAEQFEKAAQSGPFAIPVLAAKCVETLRSQDPKALQQWADERIAAIVAQHLQRVETSKRMRMREVGRVNEGTERMRSFADGDLDAFGRCFDLTYVIDDENNRVRLGDMSADDHLFVASKYNRSGKRDLLMAAFHKVVAKKVGTKRTEEVFNESEYLQTQDSIINDEAQAV